MVWKMVLIPLIMLMVSEKTRFTDDDNGHPRHSNHGNSSADTVKQSYKDSLKSC